MMPRKGLSVAGAPSLLSDCKARIMTLMDTHGATRRVPQVRDLAFHTALHRPAGAARMKTGSGSREGLPSLSCGQRNSI